MGDEFMFIAYKIWSVKKGTYQEWRFIAWHVGNTSLWVLGTYAQKYVTTTL